MTAHVENIAKIKHVRFVMLKIWQKSNIWYNRSVTNAQAVTDTTERRVGMQVSRDEIVMQHDEELPPKTEKPP